MEICEGKIAWVGKTDDIPDTSLPTWDATGKVVLPGLVDSHTHAVFHGSRVEEFELRNAGMSYLDILARGGGIHSSVRSLRDAASIGLQYEERFLAHGTTTIECKSGYGLNLESELRSLEAMKPSTLDVVRTYLGAHALPEEFENRRADFINQVLSDLEIVAERRAAEFCDVFVEPGAFTIEEASTIFAKAKRLGLGIKMHADEFQSSGGAELAARIGAVSADHLGAISDSGIRAIAQSDTIACLLPSTLFTLGHTRYAPARRLIEEGAAVALATDFNPGSSPTLNLQFVMSLACVHMNMTAAEAVSACTFNAACAIRRQKTIGSLEPGKSADFAAFDVGDFREIPYFVAVNFCSATFKRGVQTGQAKEQPG